MRMLIAALALAAVANVAVADEKDDKKDKDDKKEAKKLSIGDAAPALKVSKWLRGDKVEKFEKDRVYVVEVWATWCGPCIVMMPHVAALQEQYKKDVTVIGFTSKDERGNNEKTATEFVKNRPNLKYTFAYADDRDTYKAYMEGTGQDGIPCSFVVDKAGKLAWVGHPMYLDAVLSRVVKGKWDEKAQEEVKQTEKDTDNLFKSLGGKDPAESLEKLAAYEKKHPEMANIPFLIGPKLQLMVQAKKTDEAKKAGEKILEEAVKTGDTRTMMIVSAIMRSPLAKSNKDLLALAMKAAEASLKAAGEKDLMALYTMAETHFASGDKAKAKKYIEKAIEAAELDQHKEELRGRLKEYDAEEKKEKDKKEKKDD